ncbi:MAG: FtsX-like permease family protein [Erysipelotrichaceae bacterium]|nr:FtsX-like permease family protein [Erysipelotrichaceae bacterium]
MADEPTGALDSNTGKQVFDTLKKLSKDKLVLIVSHDKEFAKNYADRIIELSDGKIIDDTSKEHILPEKINDDISYLEGEFININDSQSLSDNDISKIIEQLKKHQGETIISFNSDTNKEIKKTNHIGEQGRIEVFKETTDKHLHLDFHPLNFIKSKLPFLASMKLALSNLKLKPIRLVITICLSVVSFTLFGLSNTASQYDKMIATYNSIIDSNVDYLSIGKEQVITENDYSYTATTKMNNDDLKILENTYPNLHFISTYSSDNYGSNFSLTSQLTETDEITKGDYTYLFYPGSISHLADIDEEIIETNHFDLTGNLPAKDHEIVITEFLANTFKTCGYQYTNTKGKTTQYNISSDEDLIGKILTLTVNNKTIDYTITGILDTHLDTTRYNSLQDNDNEDVFSYYLINELEILLDDSYHNLGYIYDEEFNNLIKNYNYYNLATDNYNLDIFSSSSDEYYFTDYLYSYDYVNKDDIIDFNNDGDVYLNFNVIKNIKIDKNTTLQNYIETNYEISNQAAHIKAIKEAVINYQNEIINSDFEIEYAYYSNLDYEYQNILDEIAGVYIGSLDDDEDYTFVATNDFIQQYHIEKDGYASYILAPMGDENTLTSVISYTYDDGINESNYTLNNQVMPMLETVNSVISILKGIFFYLAIGFAIFASVMFCNFIAISISNKQHEIGILRAVGARSLDVLKIFLNESMIIALINWLLATIACATGVTYINSYIRDEFNVLVTILDFGIVQILLILLISVVVALIACALPVFNISRKKPIDAIKNRK